MRNKLHIPLPVVLWFKSGQHADHTMANQAIENSLSGPRKTPVNGAFGVGLSFLTLQDLEVVARAGAAYTGARISNPKC